MRPRKSIAGEPADPTAGAAPAAEPGWQSWRPALEAAVEIRWQGSAQAGYEVRVYALAARPAPPFRPGPRRLAHLQRRERPAPPAEAAFLVAAARLPSGAPAALPFSVRFAASAGPQLRGTVAAEPLPEGGTRLVVRGLVHAGGEVPFAILAPPPVPAATAPVPLAEPAGPAAPPAPGDGHA